MLQKGTEMKHNHAKYILYRQLYNMFFGLMCSGKCHNPDAIVNLRLLCTY